MKCFPVIIRWNAAKIAGITEIPAIIKENLTEREAYVYVIETNMLQRSFDDLLAIGEGKQYWQSI